jgi:hypothetical protein
MKMTQGHVLIVVSIRISKEIFFGSGVSWCFFDVIYEEKNSNKLTDHDT